MAPGLLCVVKIGIQWMPVLYVDNLDTHSMVIILVLLYLSVNTIRNCLNIGARGRAYWPHWTWIRWQLRTYQILNFVHCLGSEKRLIDCSHNVSISSGSNNYFRGEASVSCQQCNTMPPF